MDVAQVLRSQRREHEEPSIGILDRAAQEVEETVAGLGIAGAEQFLHLVEHEKRDRLAPSCPQKDLVDAFQERTSAVLPGA